MRSAAITLVLAGSLAGCSDPEAQRDVYTKLDDCTKDWGTPAECSPVNDGRHSSSYFYGPRYFGSSFPSGRPKPSLHALEATPAGRGVSPISPEAEPGAARLQAATWLAAADSV